MNDSPPAPELACLLAISSASYARDYALRPAHDGHVADALPYHEPHRSTPSAPPPPPPWRRLSPQGRKRRREGARRRQYAPPAPQNKAVESSFSLSSPTTFMENDDLTGPSSCRSSCDATASSGDRTVWKKAVCATVALSGPALHCSFTTLCVYENVHDMA